jgi:hypothetical protein
MASSCKPVPPGTPNEAPEGQTWLCLAHNTDLGPVRHGICAPFETQEPCEKCVLVYKNTLVYEDGVLIKAEAVHDPEAEITW